MARVCAEIPDSVSDVSHWRFICSWNQDSVFFFFALGFELLLLSVRGLFEVFLGFIREFYSIFLPKGPI